MIASEPLPSCGLHILHEDNNDSRRKMDVLTVEPNSVSSRIEAKIASLVCCSFLEAAVGVLVDGIVAVVIIIIILEDSSLWR